VNIDDFKVHENKDGTVDRTKTDLYLHLVSNSDNSIIEVSEVLRLVDENIEQLDELFKEFNVLDTQASDALVLQTEFGNPQMIIWLVMINLIMGALLIIIVTLCLSQRTNYRRELKAARVNAYGETAISLH
jgi:cadherin 23